MEALNSEQLMETVIRTSQLTGTVTGNPASFQE